MDFREALLRMTADNQKLAAARSSIEQQKAEERAAKGLYYPQIQVSASWTHMDAPLEVELGAMGTLADTISATFPPLAPVAARIPRSYPIQEQDFLKSDLTLSWPVYTGGKISAANRAARANTLLAEQSEEGLHHQMFSELVRLYYGVRLADAVIQVRMDVQKGMEKHLQEAEKLEESGMISLAERLHARVALEEARREHQKALRDAQIARTALRSLIASRETINPSSPLFVYRAIPPLEKFMEKAREQNTMLRQLDQHKNLARAGLQKEKSAYRPDIFLFGTRALVTDDLTALDPEWAVGAGVRFTLFDGFARPGRVEAARATETRVAQLQHQAIMDLETLVESRYQLLMQALEQLDALGASETLAREHLRVRTLAFEEGFATSLDVVDAELALSGVQIARLQTLFTFDLSLARLLEAAGSTPEFDSYRIRGEKETLVP
ncbi:TolC family protein [Desulfobotulus sp. H1]|uniref:TolC family protein n=1 Tax=Desulfobotulus pelophilus TaxID=2823377 RepID=A0ABT3N5R0_9BACT|nr:TolC family protein [Desulfobotulus pelophilus]MCW7752790.1 TolC family protein [Desulfobotulus pelophilus]